MRMLIQNESMEARVYCPICTHTVEAEVVSVESGYRRKLRVIGGQRCQRCTAPLDAAFVLDAVGGLHG